MPSPSGRATPVRAGVKHFRGVLAWKIYFSQEVLSKMRAQNKGVINWPREGRLRLDSCGCTEARRPVDKVG